MREKKGITLVALVVTIIVLIILAGVSVSLVLGDNGIVTKAKLAKERTQQAKINEEDMNSAVEYIENLGENREPKFSMIDGIPIPRGFEHVEGTTKETGFVIRDNSRNATQGNEFVWVPCSEDGSNGIKYDRYAFSRDGWQFSQVKDETTGIIDAANAGAFIETMSEVEFNSVKKYGDKIIIQEV